MRAEDAVWINRKFFFFVFFLFIGLLISTGLFGYLYFFKKDTPITDLSGLVAGDSIKDVTNMTEEEILNLVGKYILLPDENPTFATVSDTQKLRGNELFKNAKPGDIVLIFEKAQKVVIFRPESSQIVEVAKITSKNQTSSVVSPTEPPSPTASLTVTPTPGGQTETSLPKATNTPTPS